MPEWATGTPPGQLPDHVRLTVSARWIELVCGRCGWLRVFRRERATSEEIIAAAQIHRCATELERK